MSENSIRRHLVSFHYKFFYFALLALGVSLLLLVEDTKSEEQKTKNIAIYSIVGFMFFVGLVSACLQFK
jgi:hypothetical protein